MAVRMHQHAVLDRILAPMGSPHDMVVVPPRHRGDLLTANRTDSGSGDTILNFSDLGMVSPELVDPGR